MLKSHHITIILLIVYLFFLLLCVYAFCDFNFVRNLEFKEETGFLCVLSCEIDNFLDTCSLLIKILAYLVFVTLVCQVVFKDLCAILKARRGPARAVYLSRYPAVSNSCNVTSSRLTFLFNLPLSPFASIGLSFLLPQSCVLIL